MLAKFIAKCANWAQFKKHRFCQCNLLARGCVCHVHYRACLLHSPVLSTALKHSAYTHPHIHTQIHTQTRTHTPT
jgi:hypothetical protein